jgi:hypothetical protein
MKFVVLFVSIFTFSSTYAYDVICGKVKNLEIKDYSDDVAFEIEDMKFETSTNAAASVQALIAARTTKAKVCVTYYVSSADNKANFVSIKL